ncbi:MAG: hypothetical protein M1814_000157 [Vezdaea aestivalis]|nr:MAG: hypothetical protein M1814_000157 [Vezdaea aestivalis]
MAFTKGMTVTGWVGVAVSTILTVARLWIRAVKLRRLHWDDATHVAALLCMVGWVAMNQRMAPVVGRLVDVQTGKAAFTTDFLTKDVPAFFKFIYAFNTLSYANLWLVKFSFMIFYKRFFRNLKGLTIAWWISLVWIIITYLGFWCTQLTIGVTPRGAFLLSGIGSAEGTRRVRIDTWILCVIDFTTDLCILVLPMGLLWRLRIPLSQRVGLAGIFSLAAITMAFCLTRAVVYNSQNHTSRSYGYSKSTNVDPSWLIFWAILESTAATCVSCLPTFRLLLQPRRKPTPAQMAQSTESYDVDGLAKIKNGQRSPDSDGSDGRRHSRARFAIRHPSATDSTSSFRQWLLRISSDRSRENSPPNSIVRWIWPGRGKLGNRGSLHGPLDSVSIPGGTLVSKFEPEKDVTVDGERFKHNKGGLKRVSEVKEAEDEKAVESVEAV